MRFNLHTVNFTNVKCAIWMSFEKYSHVTGTIIMIRNISITQERSLTPLCPLCLQASPGSWYWSVSIPLPSLNFHINESFFHLEQCFWDSYTLLHVSATYFCCCKCLLHFIPWVKFHHKDTVKFVYPLSSWWSYGCVFPPVWGYYG